MMYISHLPLLILCGLYLCLCYHVCAEKMCNSTIMGNIDANGSNYVRIQISRNRTSNSTDTFIRISTCSSETTFDTILYLLNENKTNVIDFCDDYCSLNAPLCQTGTRFNRQTIWDLYLNELIETNYVLKISGYQGQSGGYRSIFSYNCDLGIAIIDPTIPNLSSTEPDTIVDFVSSVLDVESNEISDIESDGAINLVAVVVALGVFYCCSICFCGYACLKGNNICPICDCYYLFSDKRPGDGVISSEAGSKALKIVTQLIIAFMSITASLALSDSFGLSDFDNGLLAITMALISFILSWWKFIFTDSNIHTKAIKGDSLPALKEVRLDGILSATIFGATLVDALFDILQGIAATRGEEYSGSSALLLFTATWIGVAEEIIEGVMEIASTCCECVGELGDMKVGDRSNISRWIVNWLLHIGAIVELSMGVYIFNLFDTSIFKVVAIALQGIFLLVAAYWTVYVVRRMWRWYINGDIY